METAGLLALLKLLGVLGVLATVLGAIWHYGNLRYNAGIERGKAIASEGVKQALDELSAGLYNPDPNGDFGVRRPWVSDKHGSEAGTDVRVVGDKDGND